MKSKILAIFIFINGCIAIEPNCTEFEVKEMNIAIDACFIEADSLILENHESDNPLTSVCKTIEAKVDCFELNIPRCRNATFLRNVKDNFMLEQVEGAFNQSDDLGNNLTRGCPILSEAEKRLAVVLTGHDACDGVTAIKQRRLKISCDQKATREQNEKLKLLRFLTSASKHKLFIKSECDVRADWDKCVEILTCHSDEKIAELLLSDAKIYAIREANIQKNWLESFTYAQSCAGLNN